MAGELDDFDLGSMFQGGGFGGGNMSGASASALAGSDASAFNPNDDEYKKSNGLLQGQASNNQWNMQGNYTGSNFDNPDNGRWSIANTTPEMLAAMGFSGSGMVNQGTGQNFEQVVNPDIYSYMRNQGQQYGTRYNGEGPDSMTNQIFDRSGNAIKDATSTWKLGNDDAFTVAAILAGGAMGGAAFGAAGAAGGGGAAAAGAGTNAALLESGLGTAGYGASSAGLGGGAAATATNAALIESALGTPGYGASSAGFGGGAGQTGFSLSGLGQRAGKGALFNGGMTAARGGNMNDILKSAGYGAVGGGLSYGVDTVNPGSYATDNPDWQKVVNRGVTGAGSSAMSGGNPLVGAAMGSGTQAGNVIGGNLWNSANADAGSSTMPNYNAGESTSPVKDWFANNNQQSAAPVGFTNSDEVNTSLGNNTNSSLYNPDFVSTGSAPSQEQGNPFKQMITSAMTQQAGAGGKTPQFGDMAGSLMGLYSAYQQRKKMADLRGGLQNMFSPDSAYAQQMGQQLARRDAAAGRRSQYGPRSVELQARLAELNSRNAPTIQNLIGGETQARDRGLANILRFGQQSGANASMGSWLQNMMSQYGNGGWGSGNQFGNQDLGQNF